MVDYTEKRPLSISCEATRAGTPANHIISEIYVDSRKITKNGARTRLG